jgi:hypothetical protein
VVQAHGINQQVVGSGRKRLHGGEHGQPRGLVDIDPIDGLGIDLLDGESECAGANDGVESLTVFGSSIVLV